MGTLLLPLLIVAAVQDHVRLERVLTPEVAELIFAEAASLSATDGGKLWGRPLAGPLLLADAERRVVMANAAAPGLAPVRPNVFAGTLPGQINVANTALKWGGTTWTMLRWPLPEHDFPRRMLIAHEQWHRIQGALRLPAYNPPNAHLDEEAGRRYLRLEFAALRRALRAGDDEQRRDEIAAALAFRSRRHAQFELASDEERWLELNEGLAQYTGLRLAARDDDQAVREAVALLDQFEASPTYVRSFAYATGPAYGLLLDRVALDWRARLDEDHGPAELLAAVTGVELGSAARAHAAERLAANYGDAQIAAEEHARAERRAVVRRKVRDEFVDGPILLLALANPQIGFDPNTLQPTPPHGTYYPTARLSDAWGVLEVTDGLLLAGDWKSARVRAPADAGDGELISGPGYTLRLAPGWQIERVNAGSWKLTKTASATPAAGGGR